MHRNNSKQLVPFLQNANKVIELARERLEIRNKTSDQQSLYEEATCILRDTNYELIEETNEALLANNSFLQKDQELLKKLLDLRLNLFLVLEEIQSEINKMSRAKEVLQKVAQREKILTIDDSIENLFTTAKTVNTKKSISLSSLSDTRNLIAEYAEAYDPHFHSDSNKALSAIDVFCSKENPAKRKAINYLERLVAEKKAAPKTIPQHISKLFHKPTFAEISALEKMLYALQDGLVEFTPEDAHQLYKKDIISKLKKENLLPPSFIYLEEKIDAFFKENSKSFSK